MSPKHVTGGSGPLKGKMVRKSKDRKIKRVKEVIKMGKCFEQLRIVKAVALQALFAIDKFSSYIAAISNVWLSMKERTPVIVHSVL